MTVRRGAASTATRGLQQWPLLLVVGGVALGLSALGAGSGTIVVVELLLHLLFGLEGPSLRRLAYSRGGRPVGDVVMAADAGEAEAKSFARWLEPGTMRPVTASRAQAGRYGTSEPIIGLFPDREGR